MSLPEVLSIVPFTRPARGVARLPGSKSLTNRAMLLAALAEGPATLRGALHSEDTQIMAESLWRLGFDVCAEPASDTIRIVGLGGRIPARQAELHVGNAGTAARFLAALCAAAPSGVFTIDGIEQMRNRPMKGLLDALRALGADIRPKGRDGFLPAEIHARGLAGGNVPIDARESSQMLSALLMAAPLASSPVSIRLSAAVREPFVAMTVRLMSRFGVTPRASDGAVPGYDVSPGAYRLPRCAPGSPTDTFDIEPDATAASYFLGLVLVAGGSLEIPGLGAESLQGDLQFAGVLAGAGLDVSRMAGALRVTRGKGRSTAISRDFSGFSDTFLTLAALAPLLDGPTRISGIAHTRHQETDRVRNAALELRKLGQDVVETEDSLEIHPRPLPRGPAPVVIDTHGDHRFAMSFGILGCHDLRGDGTPWLAIRNPSCCAKTFPLFFELLEALRRESSASDAR
jgi:3-phosphoshikimate 1-carboxyvinyltransferase